MLNAMLIRRSPNFYVNHHANLVNGSTNSQRPRSGALLPKAMEILIVGETISG
jgi:hypothetical protein